MKKSSFKVVTLSGSPYEIGFKHGKETAEQIEVSIKTYKEMFWNYAKKDWETALKEAKEFIPLIEGYDPDLMEEIRGVAEGSNRPVLEIVALNARSEIALTEKMLDGCTSFAVTPDATGERTYLGQNWDWKSSQRDSFVVLKIIQEKKPNIMMVTEAGIIGKIGFNDAGIGVCLNALVADENQLGLPLHIVLRGILNGEILSDAVAVLAGTNIASAANFMVGHKDGEAIDMEAVPSDFDVLTPKEGLLLHTNHFISSRLTGVKDLGKRVFVDSPLRLARAEKLFESGRGGLGMGTIKLILRDHFNYPKSICRHEDPRDEPGRRSQSVFSIIMDLEGQAMYVTDGPPCQAEYERLKADFDRHTDNKTD